MKNILLFAMALASSAAVRADFFPLAMNNTWVYRNAKSGDTFTVRVGTPVYMQSGRVYYFLSGFSGPSVLARMDEQQRLVALDEDTGNEKILASFQQDDNWWEANRVCASQGHTKSRRANYEGPAGTWDDTVELEFRTFSCADAGVTQEQYASNIGMVRRQLTSFAGPVTYDLVYAQVGSQVIEAGERGRFSVSATAYQDQGIWKATLRTDLGRFGSISLKFPSAQEYDLALKSAEGTILWTWSMDKLFALGSHEKVFGSQWSVTVDVPFPPLPAGASPGDFVIEAWLTTSPGEPKFSASAPVNLPNR